MVMFSIIQLGFTRFLTDRKEWIYLPPLRYICVCVVAGVPDIGGSAPGFWLPLWILPRKKNETRPLHMPIGPARHGPAFAYLSYAHRPGHLGPESPGLGA